MIIAAILVLTLPVCASAQSLFHAPLPPQQAQPAQQQAPAPESQPSAPQHAASDKPNNAPAQPATQPGTQPATSGENGHASAPVQPTALANAPRPALPSVQQVSLFSVQAIKPRKFFKHDKIEVIINETSIQKFEQTADSKEQSDVNASIKALPNLEAILTDFVLRNTGTPTAKVGAGNGSTYKGSGTYERKDRFTARISAIVTDVKPNGMLVIEAREMMLSDKESKQLVLSGLCDPRDITVQNTVTSSQLANLIIKTEHAGDVKDAATKGWLPRVFDAISGN